MRPLAIALLLASWSAAANDDDMISVSRAELDDIKAERILMLDVIKKMSHKIDELRAATNCT